MFIAPVEITNTTEWRVNWTGTEHTITYINSCLFPRHALSFLGYLEARSGGVACMPVYCMGHIVCGSHRHQTSAAEKGG